MSLNNGKIQTSEIKRYQSEDVSIEGTNGDIVGKKTRLNGKQGRLKKEGPHSKEIGYSSCKIFIIYQ